MLVLRPAKRGATDKGGRATDVGERWGCLSLDRASRFVVAWAAGPRETALAETVVQTTRRRTAQHAGIQWLSDGWAAYAETITDTYLEPVPGGSDRWSILRRTPGVALTQAVKHRKGRRLVAVEIQATIGPVAAQPYDVHVERFNGVLRDRLACLTRKTHAFAKQAATWDAAVGLAIFAQNCLRPHPALRRPRVVPDAQGRRYDRVTPAMAIGLTDHLWDMAEFLSRPIPHH